MLFFVIFFSTFSMTCVEAFIFFLNLVTIFFTINPVTFSNALNILFSILPLLFCCHVKKKMKLSAHPL